MHDVIANKHVYLLTLNYPHTTFKIKCNTAALCKHKNGINHYKLSFIPRAELWSVSPFPLNAFASEIGTFSVMTKKKEKLSALFTYLCMTQLLCVFQGPALFILNIGKAGFIFWAYRNKIKMFCLRKYLPTNFFPSFISQDILLRCHLCAWLTGTSDSSLMLLTP